MALALDAPFAATSEPERPASHAIALRNFTIPALASIGAGTVHAAAVGIHTGARAAVLVFAITAALQIGVGLLLLFSTRRLLAVALAAVNVAALAGWATAKTSADGIGFIDGLDTKEPVRWADGLGAALAGAAIVALAFAAGRGWRLPTSRRVVAAVAVPFAIAALSGVVSAGSITAPHAEPELVGGVRVVEVASAVPPTPFIPGQPIDLGGVEGVSAEEQARAENLLASTLYLLPQFADPAVAEARGWQSIGDGVTGEEHFVNPSTFDDGKLLDPTAPESLVYDVIDGKRTLAAAMFMMPTGATLDQVPPLGGKLTQWHVHNNLCFNAAGKIAGIRSANGPCAPGLVQGGETPMIHVWIRSHPCGPFSALEGIGGGTIAEGATRLCDAAHGADPGH